MIKAFLFDLDGTLVQTEKLKALSYAIVVQQLTGLPEPDQRAVKAYQEVMERRRTLSRNILSRNWTWRRTCASR